MFPTLLSRSCSRGVLETQLKRPKVLLPTFQESSLIIDGDNINNLSVSDKLKYARMKNHLTIAELCRQIHFTDDAYARYENGTTTIENMNPEILLRISNLCGVDVLDSYHKFKLQSDRVVDAYMKHYGVSIRKLAQQLSVSPTTIKNWKNKKCSPSLELWRTTFEPYFVDFFAKEYNTSETAFE